MSDHTCYTCAMLKRRTASDGGDPHDGAAPESSRIVCHVDDQVYYEDETPLDCSLWAARREPAIA